VKKKELTPIFVFLKKIFTNYENNIKIGSCRNARPRKKKDK